MKTALPETTLRAVRSLRVCAHLNIRQARAARRAGRHAMAGYHAGVALACRRDAHALVNTSR